MNFDELYLRYLGAKSGKPKPKPKPRFTLPWLAPQPKPQPKPKTRFTPPWLVPQPKPQPKPKPTFMPPWLVPQPKPSKPRRTPRVSQTERTIDFRHTVPVKPRTIVDDLQDVRPDISDDLSRNVEAALTNEGLLAHDYSEPSEFVRNNFAESGLDEESDQRTEAYVWNHIARAEDAVRPGQAYRDVQHMKLHGQLLGRAFFDTSAEISRLAQSSVINGRAPLPFIQNGIVTNEGILDDMYLGSLPSTVDDFEVGYSVGTILHEFGHVIDRRTGFTASLYEPAPEYGGQRRSVALGGKSGVNMDKQIPELAVEGFGAKEAVYNELAIAPFVTDVVEVSGETLHIFSILPDSAGKFDTFGSDFYNCSERGGCGPRKIGWKRSASGELKGNAIALRDAFREVFGGFLHQLIEDDVHE